MQNSNKISQYYYIFSQCETEQDRSSKLDEFISYLGEQKQLAKYFASTLKSRLVSFTPENTGELRQIIVVCQRMVSKKMHRNLFEDLTKKQIDVFGQYIKKQSEYIGLKSTILFVQKMFLEHGMAIYSHSKTLFKAFLTIFLDIKQQNIQQLLSELLVQMLLDNKKLVKYANSPYYFMQFWIHVINQQPQLDRKIYWIQSIKKLYSSEHGEQGLFYESDFRTLIDMLIRIGSQCPNGKTLRVPLQCYLVLCCTKIMKQPYRLQDIKDFLQCLDTQQLGLNDVASEINSLG